MSDSIHHRHTTRGSRGTAPLRRALGVIFILGLASDAAAQVALDRYSAPPTPNDGLHLSRPVGLGHQRLAGLLAVDFSDDPLVLELESGLAETERTRLVDHQLEAHARVAYGLFDRLVLSGGLDAALAMAGESFDNRQSGSTLAAADGAGLGDARLGVRYVALGTAESFGALGVEAQVTLPLARGANRDQSLSGERSVTFQPRVLGEIRPGRFRITANTGLIVRERTDVVFTSIGNELGLGLGAALTLPGALQTFELLTEAYGTTPLGDVFASEATPIEALLGGRWRPDERWRVTLAGGTGVQRAVGSPDVRALASVGFVGVADADADADHVLDGSDRCPFDAEDIDGHDDGDGCPDADDSDGDGILDTVDACRGEPEDQDGFQDGDGCPDRDDDADGVDDGDDRCPRELEDRDGFADTDGCPDADDDQDGVLDAADTCSDRAEDVDGFQDGDGCPDPDNDGDGIADASDACPLERGSAPGGCPTVQLTRDRIEIRERVEFAARGDAILADSEPLLEQIRTLLEQHPEVTQVAVAGHTDGTGAAAFNQTLSERRALAVVRWLTARGIAGERLSAWGCGSQRPLDSDASEDGRRKNRRVELLVLEPRSETAADVTQCRRVPGGLR